MCTLKRFRAVSARINAELELFRAENTILTAMNESAEQRQEPVKELKRR